MVSRSGAILGQSRSSRLWEDFGGAREGSETPFATALRELSQETGLSAKDLEFGDRAPVVIEHAGHVHVVYVASIPARSSAFEVATDGTVLSTAETDGELSSFVCFRGFEDFFATELGDHTRIHRRIKDRRGMALAVSVWRDLQVEQRGTAARSTTAATKGTSQNGKAPGSKRTSSSCAVSGVRAASHAPAETVTVSSFPAITEGLSATENDGVGDVGDVGGVGDPPARPGGGGRRPCDAQERISRGNQTRSVAGKRWENHTLTKLLAIRSDPEVLVELEELSRLVETSFSAKAVRQDKDKQHLFYSTMGRVV